MSDPDAVRQRWVDRLPALLALIGGLIVIALAYGIFSGTTVMGPDFASYVLPAAARAQGHGVLYADYFDVKPPLTYAVFVPWVALFGPSLAGLWVFYAALLGLMMTGFWVALRQQLSAWLALVLFGFAAIVVVFGGLLEEFFFTTEVIGLVPVLWGLVIARWRGDRMGWLFLAVLLLGLSGQVKEVFLFTPIALLPIAWANPRRWRALAVVAGGVTSAVAFTAVVLLTWGSAAMPAYLEIIGLKRDRFPAPDVSTVADLVAGYLGIVRTWLPLLLLFAIALVVVALVPARRPAARVWQLSPGEWSVVLLFGSLTAAFTWQGSLLTGYHAVAIVYPLYLVLAVLFSRGLVASAWMSRNARIAVGAVLLIGMLPSVAALDNAVGRTATIRPVALVAAFESLEQPSDLVEFDAIHDLGKAGGCLQVIDGWESSAYYVYADMPPCSPFVLPPLVGMHPVLGAELIQALKQHPPSVLVVDRSWLDSGNRDYGLDPRLTTKMRDVADRCYRVTGVSPSVLVPRGGEDATRACLAAAFADAGV